MATSLQFSQLKALQHGGLGIPVLLMALLAMMTLPVPAFLLDVLFTFNILLSLVVLLVCVYAMRPMDFPVFPTVLLVTTLLRLGLNVASTRIVLLEGHEGGDAAGKVIQAFGEVLIGGNYAVGLIVFAILMIINFAVVTKGAGRVSEVSARFTLDAMPGKQMAIDADLNAGLIEADEAKKRRADIATEADFYGSMDGASKFVKGDAVAGILILVINLLGGVGIGMMQHGLTFTDAMQVYALLTIGDGLVAQIPSLLLSVAAAIMVTRVSASQDMGGQIFTQLFGGVKALGISSAILFIMGIIPGMPHLAFLSLAALGGGITYLNWKKTQTAELVDETPVEGAQRPTKAGAPAQSGPVGRMDQPALPGAAPGSSTDTKELGWDDVSQVDIVGLEVGYRLIPLVDKSQGGQLLGRIKGVRKKLSQELGFLMPSVHIRDNLDLMPNTYRITLMGVTIAEADIHPDREMAINPGQVFGKLDGIQTTDPAFGLEAIWIDTSKKEQAQTLGYTVVDASTVVATHLNQILSKHAHELLGHEDVQNWLEQLGKHSEKLAEELVPTTVSVSLLLKVLQQLLREDVAIRDMRSIAEAIIGISPKTQDAGLLTSHVRVALRRMIVQNIIGQENELPVITLDPALEQLLLKSLQQTQQSQAGEDIGLLLEPGMMEKLQTSLRDAAQRQEMLGKPALLLVSQALRPAIARFVRLAVDRVHVLSYQEIPESKQITIVATVSG